MESSAHSGVNCQLIVIRHCCITQYFRIQLTVFINYSSFMRWSLCWKFLALAYLISQKRPPTHFLLGWNSQKFSLRWRAIKNVYENFENILSHWHGSQNFSEIFYQFLVWAPILCLGCRGWVSSKVQNQLVHSVSTILGVGVSESMSKSVSTG